MSEQDERLCNRLGNRNSNLADSAAVIRSARRNNNQHLIGIITVAALALIGMVSIAIAMAVITWEEWDE